MRWPPHGPSKASLELIRRVLVSLAVRDTKDRTRPAHRYRARLGRVRQRGADRDVRLVRD